MAVRGALFLSSYALFFGLFALRLTERPVLAVALSLVMVLGVIATGWIAFGERAKEPSAVVFTVVKDEGGEVAGYLVTYLLPLLAVSNPSDRDLVGYGLFLVVLVVVWLQSDLIVINPLLYLFGWRVYRVGTAQLSDKYLLSRFRPREGATLRVTRLSNDVYVGHGLIGGRDGG
jgi:hypothetical protein